MCAMKTNKLELLTKPSVSYCHGCLSSDRALSVLGELVDIFLKICVYPYKISTSQIYLCWECIAMLKTMRRFKMRVIEAQKILHMNENKNQNELETLSKLKTVTPNLPIEITHVDEKPLAVKQEIEDHYDDAADFSPHEEDIKVKQEPEIKVNKYSKKQYCKLVFDMKKEELIRRFRIDFNEIESWRERDLKSELFAKFKYKCFKCIAGWNSKNKYEEHNKKYHGEPPGGYTCATCGTRVGSKPRLRAHVAAHGAGLACALCEFSSASPALARAHLHAHSAAVQCLICGARLKSMMSFYKHYKATHKVFLCDHCGKSCKSKHMLEKHISKQHSPHECKSCNKRYKDSKSLRKHVWLKHQRCAAEHAYCAPCDVQFDTRAMYNQHVRTGAAHAKERQDSTKQKVPCPECSNVYSRKTYMMNHYRHVHMNQSKYYCTQCDRPFLNRTRYLEHTKYKHEGIEKEKNKLCSICGRGFAATRTLVNHMRTHSGERPYECPKCGRGFTQKHAMIIHSKHVHGPRKPV